MLLNSTCLTLKPLASSVYVHVPEAPSPHERSITVTSLFPSWRQAAVNQDRPVPGPIHGPGAQDEVLAGVGASPESAPPPLLGTLHQFGAHGVGLDVSAEREEVLVLCHGKALESPLVEVSCPPAVIVLMVPADVRYSDPPHQPPQRDLGPRPDDQMPVTGHQAVSQ